MTCEVSSIQSAREVWIQWAKGAHWYRETNIGEVNGRPGLVINIRSGYTEEATRTIKNTGVEVPYLIYEQK